MAAKKRKVLKEVFDFSEWALQDIMRASLPPVASSDPPPARWLGVQSLASIATGSDGKVIVCNAAKRGVHFELIQLVAMSRTGRSRSPRGELALALPASSCGPLPRSFDLDKMELTLGGQVVKVYRFADDPDMPWFQAKPIVTYLGYRNITGTLKDNVYSEDKSALQALIDTKGAPLRGVSSQLTPPPQGYNELKAIHINEPALYSLIFAVWLGRDGARCHFDRPQIGTCVAFSDALSLSLSL
jgi:hypothetical protein